VKVIVLIMAYHRGTNMNQQGPTARSGHGTVAGSTQRGTEVVPDRHGGSRGSSSSGAAEAAPPHWRSGAAEQTVRGH
jgi:hypothetical protein